MSLSREQKTEIVKWYKDERLTAAAALRRAADRGWDLKRATAYNLRMKVLGVEGDTAPQQMHRAIKEDAAEPLQENPDNLQEHLRQAEAVAQGVEAIEGPLSDKDGAQGQSAGPLDQLEFMRSKLAKLAARTEDPKVAAALAKSLMDLIGSIRAIRKEDGTGEIPRALVFLPIKRPDPNLYDPNDPGSWPDNPYARPPLAPDPAIYPPDNPKSWPDNPYARYPYRPYSCTCWGSQIWDAEAALAQDDQRLRLAADVVTWLRTLPDDYLMLAPREVLAALEAAP